MILSKELVTSTRPNAAVVADVTNCVRPLYLLVVGWGDECGMGECKDTLEPICLSPSPTSVTQVICRRSSVLYHRAVHIPGPGVKLKKETSAGTR